jgi:pimeloyl-ACP methyl ester carboxylesterase
LLIALLSVLVLAMLPRRPQPDLTASAPIVLSVVHRDANMVYKLNLPDGQVAELSCARFTWEKIAVSVSDRGAVGDHVRCTRGRTKARKLLIWIHGGPWAFAGTSLVLEQLAFLDAGYDLFVPHYPGSSDRPLELEGLRMQPDVLDAFQELGTAFKWGRRNYEAVEVAGESFGAFLAVSLLPQLRDGESLFLMNPSLAGRGALDRLYQRDGDQLKINGVRDDETAAKAKRITSAYFARLSGYNPTQQLQSTPGLRLKLIHAGADPLMDQNEIKLLRRLAVAGCGVDFRPESGHELGYTLEHIESTRNLIKC